MAPLFVLALCLSIGAQVACAHGDGSVGEERRIPGMPDFKRVGNTTYRYMTAKEEYIVLRPGKPTAFMHWDPIAGVDSVDAEGNAEGARVKLPPNELQPICRTSGQRVVIVWSGQGSPTSEEVSKLRSIVKRMTWKIADQSSRSSDGHRVVQLAVDCDAEGNISIYNKAPFGMPTGTDAVKYLWFSTDTTFGGGSAEAISDLTKSRNNQIARNSSGGSFANYEGYGWELDVGLHELFHEFGAVEKAEPHPPFATEGRHCIDGLDVMCYEDHTGSFGGGGYTETHCPESEGFLTPTGIPLDCHYDTYFNAAAPAGSWLASHWNVAEPEDPYLATLPTKPPKAKTEAPASVQAGAATLRGTVTPEADYAFYYFEYGLSTEYGSSAPTPKKGVGTFGTNSEVESWEVKNLTPKTTYHYRLVAVNDNGEKSFGADQTFTTGVPSAETEPASKISAKSATLNGLVKPESIEASYHFEYGKTTAYGNSIPIQDSSVGSGGAPVAVSQNLTGLTPEETYHYRIVATSLVGTVYGSDQMFTTIWPTVSTEPADTIGRLSARAQGTVNPHGSATNVYFEYGLTQSYGTTTKSQSAGSTFNDVKINKVLEGLTPGATYHFRMVATCEGHTSYGNDQQFTTSLEAPPVATTGTASEVERKTAVVNATVNPEGLATTYQFEYGTTTAYGIKVPIPEKSIGPGGADLQVSESLGGLSPETTYHFRVVATNAKGSSLGTDKTFKTTATGKPAITVEGVIKITETSATVAATINPEGSSTIYAAVYGVNAGPPYEESGAEESIGEGTSSIKVTQTITGLKPATTYHISVGAYNGQGIAYGEDLIVKVGTSWSLQTTPNPPPIPAPKLEAVSCPASSTCLAAGFDSLSQRAFLTRWNGTEWAVLLKDVEANAVTDIACTSTTVCFVVGTKTGGIGSLAQKWRKEASTESWTRDVYSVPSPEGASEVELKGVSCSSESACTAVGSYVKEAKTKTLAERWNGTSWSIQTTANPESGNATLRSVSCDSATSCTAVGTKDTLTFAERWNGTSWSITSTPSPGTTSNALEGVSCTSGSSCTAVGFLWSSEGRKPLALRWNGTEWSLTTTPTPSEALGYTELHDVTCTSATSCTAVGSYYIDKWVGYVGKHKKTLVESWNGTSWSIVSSPNAEGKDQSSLKAIACSAASACTAVGSVTPVYNGTEMGTLAERWE